MFLSALAGALGGGGAAAGGGGAAGALSNVIKGSGGGGGGKEKKKKKKEIPWSEKSIDESGMAGFLNKKPSPKIKEE